MIVLRITFSVMPNDNKQNLDTTLFKITDSQNYFVILEYVLSLYLKYPSSEYDIQLQPWCGINCNS